jgi:hypothetical protein
MAKKIILAMAAIVGMLAVFVTAGIITTSAFADSMQVKNNNHINQHCISKGDTSPITGACIGTIGP